MKHALVAACATLATACAGGYDLAPYQDGEASEDIVLGTTLEALSYPVCTSPWADPDGDGWGWEYNRSCVVQQPSTSTWGYYGYYGYGWGYTAPAPAPAPEPAPAPTTTTTTTSSSTCANPEGTASTMAAIAVAAAMELKRWQPTRDFAIGRIGYDEAVVLTSTGRARCADGVCAETQALLDFQKNEANGQVVFPGGAVLNSPALRSRMVAKYRDQLACESQPSNGGTTNCPVEDHQLTFQRSEKGGCDTNFFFVAKRPDGTSLKYPGQLKNKLLWVDRTNPYVGFQSVGEVVSIDPTYGLNQTGSTTTGSCTPACTKISSTNIAGQCCTCNGRTKTYKRSAWSTRTYLCQ